MIQFLKSYSLEHMLSQWIFLCKIAMIGYYLNIDIYLALYHLIAILFIHQLFEQPKYFGKSNIIPILSEEEFDEQIIKQKEDQKGIALNTQFQNKLKQKYLNQAKKYLNVNTMWFVLFTADTSETCKLTQSIWADFSIKYSNPNFKFLEINLLALPEFSEIKTKLIDKELPTIIIFEDGKPIQRFPPNQADANFQSIKKRYKNLLEFQRNSLASYFDLENRYYSTLQ